MPQLLNPVPKWVLVAFLVVSFLGFLDATYLTIEHFKGVIPPCTFLAGCELVTTSSYSVVFGVPVALGGSLYYLTVFVLSVLSWQFRKEKLLRIAFALTIFGVLASLWFLYLQIFVIKAICIYCVFSVITSTTLFVVAIFGRRKLQESSLGQV